MKGKSVIINHLKVDAESKQQKSIDYENCGWEIGVKFV